MPAGTDLIFFDNSADWELAAEASRVARQIGENAYELIQPFNLGVSLNTDYVAVIATSTKAKPNWVFAGDIAQVYDFPKGASTSNLGKIQPARVRLFLNKLQLVETNRVSTDSFDLRYSPPYWFRSCAIRVYKYVGDKVNFVEDTLFDIGNALGTDPNTVGTALDVQFGLLEVLINAKFEQLQEENEKFQLANIQDRLDILDQINQLDAGVYTLAEGLANLLPPEQRQQLLQQTQNRLDSDLGFL